MNEKTLENKIKEHLKKNGHFHFKFFANALTKTGVPDIIACINGRFVGIEVKNPNGKGVVSPLQKLTCDEINKQGGKAIIVDNFDKYLKFYEEVIKDVRNVLWWHYMAKN